MVNGHDKQQETNITERKPSIKEMSPVHINGNIEIGRLEMEDITERELNNLCEYYYEDLLEEIIQSDFEKPSIPEVILAVITDLTNDDEENKIDLENNDSIYYFNQDTPHSTSSSIINSNNDMDIYYTQVNRTKTNFNGHDTVASTDSSDKSVALIPIINETSDELQVKIL